MHAHSSNPVAATFSFLPSNSLHNNRSFSVRILDETTDLTEQSLNLFGLYNPESITHSFQSSPTKTSSISSPHFTDPVVASRHRSLTAPSPFYEYHEMMALAPQAPGSPPGLTASKSSKSSSFHSSSFSSPDGILADLAHFEDIGLNEDHHNPMNHDLYGYNKHNSPKRSLSRITAATMSGIGSVTPDITAMRELTNGTTNPGFTSLKAHSYGVVNNSPSQSLNLPNGLCIKRGLSNPSTPSLAVAAMRSRTRSRSPSPAHPVSPRTMQISSFQECRGKSPGAPSSAARRNSWQPNRKTLKELEEEYHDSDEDLPDDASLWNVPLSPRPPHARASISASASTNVSTSTSPERPASLGSSLANNVVKQRPPHTAPAASPASPGGLDRKPSSPTKPRLPRGASTSMVPDHFNFPKSRTKSWTVALSELSEEAKSLTEALEAHAGVSERQLEDVVQNGGSIVRPSIEKVTSTRKSMVELPPLRVSNVMIDPLPVSREKEKVLSRTRPSWLPPKSRKEERKHLKEYQRMMEMSLETERRKAARAADIQCSRDDTKITLLRIWEEHVLPNWDQAIREPRTRELWWRGVAPKSRAEVWKRGIGNDLALTEGTYIKALQRAKDVEHQISKGGNAELQKEKACFDAIRRDVKLVFPDLTIFQPGGPLHDDLVDVLMAYSMYRSDVGYSYGTHLIAGLLTLTLPDPTETFISLCNLLNRPLLLAFLTTDPGATQKVYRLTHTLLLQKLPRLHNHLFGASGSGLGLNPEEVLDPMFRTLFLGPGGGPSLEIAVRIWDVMIFDGDSMIIRTVVAMLGALEGKLYGDRKDVLDVLGWDAQSSEKWDLGREEDMMARVRSAGKEEKGLR